MNKIKKSETEWKKLLDEKTYNITRKSGTEQPFTGKYLNEKSKGIYNCVCCDNELFSSDTKFDSKSGWPSFFDVINNADDSGIKSAENFLDKTGTITSEKSKLDYPGTSKNNYVRSIFDQLFYGPELYNKIFQKNSLFTERGLIENDDIIVSPKLIQVLKKRFSDKIAVVTGRGYNAINSSLKEILTQFNVENSVFLEDEPRNLAKPNPESLIRSIKGLNSKNCLYVGDSMEDLIMAQRASELGFQTTFCGIYGSGKLPEVKKKFFVEQNVPFILESINFIPKALNLV